MSVESTIFPACTTVLDTIPSTQCIGDSLATINSNFSDIEDALNSRCSTLNTWASSVSLELENIAPVGAIVAYELPPSTTVRDHTAASNISTAADITTAVNAGNKITVSQSGTGSTWQVCNGAARVEGTGNTPDLRGQFIVGAGTYGSAAHQYNDTGGESDVTLTISQIPSHNHTYLGGATGTVRTGASGTAREAFLAAPTAQNSGNKGGGASHENEPPWTALLWIQRVA